jgi:hypothetical protein
LVASQQWLTLFTEFGLNWKSNPKNLGYKVKIANKRHIFPQKTMGLSIARASPPFGCNGDQDYQKNSIHDPVVYHF